VSVSAIGPLGRSPSQAVEPQRTPVSVNDLRAAIDGAYQRVTGRAPSASLLRSLTAQASVETGGGKAMYNFNFGGIKGSGPQGKSAACMTHEVISGKDVTVRQNFRAYSSLEQGAEDYVRVLVGKFGGALPSAASGNLGGFAHALKQAGYYTASESDYTAALTSAVGASPNLESQGILPVPAGSFASSIDIARLFDALSISALKIADPSPAE
jgi:hypothetical protein